MEICTCSNPELKPAPSGNFYCGKCGHWWEPKHGSIPHQKFHDDGELINPPTRNQRKKAKQKNRKRGRR